MTTRPEAAATDTRGRADDLAGPCRGNATVPIGVRSAVKSRSGAARCWMIVCWLAVLRCVPPVGQTIGLAGVNVTANIVLTAAGQRGGTDQNQGDGRGATVFFHGAFTREAAYSGSDCMATYISALKNRRLPMPRSSSRAAIVSRLTLASVNASEAAAKPHTAP